MGQGQQRTAAKQLETWKVTNNSESSQIIYSGPPAGDCETIDYYNPQADNCKDTTTAVTKLIRTTTLFPCASLLLMIVGTILGVLGQRKQQRKHWTFVAGVMYIIAGLTLVVGIILYISNINNALSDRPATNGHQYRYEYGYSFVLVAVSFGLSEICGVLCMYLYIQRHKEEDRNEQKRMQRLRRYAAGQEIGNEASNRLVGRYRCPEVMIPA
ncbi:voltage-dependent calcium channel gamma-5 subunit-like [Glandiceps talaboti]